MLIKLKSVEVKVSEEIQAVNASLHRTVHEINTDRSDFLIELLKKY